LNVWKNANPSADHHFDAWKNANPSVDHHFDAWKNENTSAVFHFQELGGGVFSIGFDAWLGRGGRWAILEA
jgi:hypothetical protein